jgi:hypothetical protein
MALLGFIRASLVVFFHPFFCQGSHFSDIGTEIGKENSFAVESVKPFDLSLCNGLPGWINQI